MQAVILAAGMGKRLKDLTSEATKCMVKVNGISMIERMLNILDRHNLKKIIIVVGYEAQKLIDYVNSLEIKTKIEYVSNDVYNKTNNIYSLYLAKDYLIQDDTLLLESDLIFDEKILDYLINNPYPSLALVAKFESWMDGTVVELDEEDNIVCFRSKKEFKFEDIPNYYKTVNIYKFSKEFSATHYVPFLEAYCKALGNNEYYEQVLKVITLLDKPEIKAVRLNDESWYEIDDIQDLDIAESIFAEKEEKLKKFQSRYGGYWRYPQMLDFCYLVNPFFPNQKLVDELKANFERLLCNYPSGMDVNSLLAAKYFDLNEENILVGNGAAELIKSLMSILPGKIGVQLPTFEEYVNRAKEDTVQFTSKSLDYSYTADDLIEFYKDKDISTLLLINPDNPSGNMISRKDLIRLAEFTMKKGIKFIVDESFSDFSNIGLEQSLLNQDVLKKYQNLVVVKSISKSYGVPGLRLGVLASYDNELILNMKKDVAIWNINSFAEFYLQIWEKYKSEYKQSIQEFQSVRKEYIENLNKIKKLKIIPSQANYVMCEVLPPYNSAKLTEDLLNDYNIFIKDLSNKNGFDGKQFIRIAIRDRRDNDALVTALSELLKD